MHRPNRIPITDLNLHLTCKLCTGYFIDATTIVECLHTFCRSCIVKYLESNKYCPVCDVQIHKSKPLLNIRPDKTLQDIVYKLVPRLYQNEIQRRKEFYDSHSESKPSLLEKNVEATYNYILSPEETVCLALNYHSCKGLPRYLSCPAAVSVAHLEKLIRAKYDLNDGHHVDILYNQDCLNPTFTLMDVAYIYSWMRKGPLELTYKIYEYASKKPKVDEAQNEEDLQTNNNNWKEVQLRISENGEMSITGVEDSDLDIVNNEKYKKDIVNVHDIKPVKSTIITTKKELPALKYIGKTPQLTISTILSTGKPTITTTQKGNLDLNKADIETTQPNHIATTSCNNNLITLPDHHNLISKNHVVILSTTSINTVFVSSSNFSSACASLSSATTTTVFSSSTKCSTKSDDKPLSLPPKVTESTNNSNSFMPKTVEKNELVVDDTKNVVTNNNVEKGVKRKLEESKESESGSKQQKPTILNHSVGLLSLSNNHPLKKHSNKLNRNGENVVEKHRTVENIGSDNKVSTTSTSSSTTTTTVETLSSELVFSKPGFINKNITSVQVSRPGTPITTPVKLSGSKPVNVSQPCYMPKTGYSPIINVPKPTTSLLVSKCETKPKNENLTIKTSTVKPDPSKSIMNTLQPTVNVNNSKMNIKSKASTPIGYKTLRDPPKSWNSQISKANVSKTLPDSKYSDNKNVRPAKFFKMRNNMPRYLGNPASGVKPMYQVHVSPEKEKPPQEQNKVEKNENIKKHSIVKIDPKTLKPISEKAPETTSLSNQSSEIKINTSSVSIFNPLKLQSSPKSERKSPKSPNSPKLKSPSPTNKREKLNLSFTPPNPFVPNLASPTMSPNQFLYPTGPPGFRSYDPHVIAAYHQLWYSQRMPFPAPPPLGGFNLDLNQRKSYDMMGPPTSPKMGLSQQSNTSQVPQKSPQLSLQTTIPRTTNSIIPTTKSHSIQKKPHKDSGKNEKSLENTVEKLTQNRVKEFVKNEAATRVNNCTETKPETLMAINNGKGDLVVISSSNKTDEKVIENKRTNGNSSASHSTSSKPPDEVICESNKVTLGTVNVPEKSSKEEEMIISVNSNSDKLTTVSSTKNASENVTDTDTSKVETEIEGTKLSSANNNSNNNSSELDEGTTVTQ